MRAAKSGNDEQKTQYPFCFAGHPHLYPDTHGNPDMELLLGTFLGLVTLLCAVAIYTEFRYKLNSLDARVRKLEEAKQKRINYESLESLENAIAAFDVLAREIEIKQSVLDNLKEHLFKARNPGKK